MSGALRRVFSGSVRRAHAWRRHTQQQQQQQQQQQRQQQLLLRGGGDAPRYGGRARGCSSGSKRSGTLHTDVGVTHAEQMSARITPELERAIFTETPLIFDTHSMVAYLRQAGFSHAQSEAVTDAMVRVSQHANRHHQNQMVTKNEFVSLRSELSILEKADFALLKTDINAIEKRMETSVAEIYTAVERVENRVIKWVIAVAGAIGLAIIRLTTTSSGGANKGAGHPPASNVDHSLAVPRIVRGDDKRVLVT